MSDYSNAYMQKKKIENTYSLFECSIGFPSNTLTCRGKIKPIESCDEYEIEIVQRPNRRPNVKVISPKIKPSPKIHTYRDGTLCLYYPSDMAWKPSTLISEYTIPWIVEWILYYEIYKISGKWEGKEAPHATF